MPKQRRKNNRSAGRLLPAFSFLIMAFLLVYPFFASPALATPLPADLAAMPLTFPIQSPDVAAYFNQIARPDDIATVSGDYINSISLIKAGKKMLGFASWEGAEGQIESYKGQISGVLYDPEHWENTPQSEQQNLPATIQHAAEFTHARGLVFFVAPDRRFVEESLADFAPYVDLLMLQGQRAQEDTQLLAGWVHEKTQIARKANPNIKIFVQVGATRGSAQVMLTALQAISEDIDGIAVWSMPRTLGILQELVDLVRQSPPVMPPASPTTALQQAAVATATPTAEATAVSTPAATPTPTIPVLQTPETPSPTSPTQVSSMAAATSTPSATPAATATAIPPEPATATLTLAPTLPVQQESHWGITMVITIIAVITVILLLGIYLTRNWPRKEK